MPFQLIQAACLSCTASSSGKLPVVWSCQRLIPYDKRIYPFFWEQQEWRKAVCMARHRRLGTRSWWRELHEEILRMVLRAPIPYIGEDEGVCKGKEEGEEEEATAAAAAAAANYAFTFSVHL